VWSWVWENLYICWLIIMRNLSNTQNFRIQFKTDNEAKIRREIRLITANEREKLNNIRSRSGWLSRILVSSFELTINTKTRCCVLISVGWTKIAHNLRGPYSRMCQISVSPLNTHFRHQTTYNIGLWFLDKITIFYADKKTMLTLL
jgi:hypothetical protein